MTKAIFDSEGNLVMARDWIEETAEHFRYPDLILPKTVVPGYTIGEVTLPVDYGHGDKYLWDKNSHSFVANPNWRDPSIVVPEAVSPYQARVALASANLLSTVDTMVANSNTIVQLAWNYATEVRRDSPFIEAMGSQLGLSNTQIDNLFIEAAKVK